MRWIGMICALGFAGQALASFDMLLVLDSTQNVVHRYDGDTGVYLGNFGGGILAQVRGIGIDQASQTAFVTMQGGYSAFNYFTGEFKFYTDRPGANYNDVFVTNSGQLLLSNGSSSGTTAGVRMTDLTVNSGGTVFSGGGSAAPYVSFVQNTDGDYYAVKGTTNQVIRYNPGGSVVSTLAFAGLVGTTKGDMLGFRYVALNASGSAVSAFLSAGSSTTGFPLLNPFTSSVEFASAHPGSGWGLGTNASGTRIQKYFVNSGGTGSFVDPIGVGRTLSQVTTPAGLAVVVAPEPGTMAALGLGIAALLRKRRR